MLLYWQFLKFATANRYPVFDFGRSTPGEGTFRFKKQWGAIPQFLHWAEFDPLDKNRDGLDPSKKHTAIPKDSFRKIAETIISKAPISMTRFMGSCSRRYITL